MGVLNGRVKWGEVWEKGLEKGILREICIFFVKDFILLILAGEYVKHYSLFQHTQIFYFLVMHPLVLRVMNCIILRCYCVLYNYMVTFVFGCL